MKYIKTYEKCTDREKLMYDDCSDCQYWMVNTKYPDILVALKKIGAPEKKLLDDLNKYNL